MPKAAPHCLRNLPRRRRHRPDRPLARQNPHQTPRGLTPIDQAALIAALFDGDWVCPERHPGRPDVTTSARPPSHLTPETGGPPAYLNLIHPVLRSWEQAQHHRLALASGNTPGRPVADARRTAAPAPGPPTHPAALQNPLDHAHWTPRRHLCWRTVDRPGRRIVPAISPKAPATA